MGRLWFFSSDDFPLPAAAVSIYKLCWVSLLAASAELVATLERECGSEGGLLAIYILSSLGCMVLGLVLGFALARASLSGHIGDWNTSARDSIVANLLKGYAGLSILQLGVAVLGVVSLVQLSQSSCPAISRYRGIGTPLGAVLVVSQILDIVVILLF